jgi:hypothetical protein
MVWSQYTFALRNARQRHHIAHIHGGSINDDPVDHQLHDSTFGGAVTVREPGGAAGAKGFPRRGDLLQVLLPQGRGVGLLSLPPERRQALLQLTASGP